MLFLTIFILCLSNYVNGKCESCPPIPKLYEEIGCSRIIQPGECCPESYNCPDITNYDRKKCHYWGKIYKQSESLPDSDKHPCNVGCFCMDTEPARFVCAQLDCPEWLGSDEGCLQQYTLSDCCASKTICDQSEMEKVMNSTCEYDGKIYIYGQKIYSDREPCYECICDDSFKNDTNFVDQWTSCRNIDCGIEIHYSFRLQNGCAPIYYGENQCCPFDWRCPEEDDKIAEKSRTNAPIGSYSSFCKYGNLTLPRSDTLELDDECLTCTCVHPPMIECIKLRNC